MARWLLAPRPRPRHRVGAEALDTDWGFRLGQCINLGQDFRDGAPAYIAPLTLGCSESRSRYFLTRRRRRMASTQAGHQFDLWRNARQGVRRFLCGGHLFAIVAQWNRGALGLCGGHMALPLRIDRGHKPRRADGSSFQLGPIQLLYGVREPDPGSRAEYGALRLPGRICERRHIALLCAFAVLLLLAQLTVEEDVLAARKVLHVQVNTIGQIVDFRQSKRGPPGSNNHRCNTNVQAMQSPRLEKLRDCYASAFDENSLKAEHL